MAGEEQDNVSNPTILSCPWSMENTRKQFIIPKETFKKGLSGSHAKK